MYIFISLLIVLMILFMLLMFLLLKLKLISFIRLVEENGILILKYKNFY